MRLMTTNIWGDYFGNLENLLQVYAAYQPDVIGFQEVSKGWYESGLFQRLEKKYRFVGTEIVHSNNFVPMAVRRDLTLLAKGYEPLCLGTDRTKGLTWVVLRDGEEKTFAVCNVHFWWKYGEEIFDRYREENARALCTVMEYLSKRFSCPVFALGDMNCVRTHTVFTEVYASRGVCHLYDLAQERDDVCSIRENPVCDESGAYHGRPSSEGASRSIDHIVALPGGFDVLQYRLVTEQMALDVSDHCPVYADVELR